jgi:hypothetical protein
MKYKVERDTEGWYRTWAGGFNFKFKTMPTDILIDATLATFLDNYKKANVIDAKNLLLSKVDDLSQWVSATDITNNKADLLAALDSVKTMVKVSVVKEAQQQIGV